MTVEHEVVSEENSRMSADRSGRLRGEPVSRATIAAYAVAAALLLGWFLFGMLVLRQGLINSLGETVGTASALLLIVSIIGTARQNRRHRQ